MYIELAANHYQAPLGAKYDPLHIPLLMELVIYVGRLVYKHQAPTELRGMSGSPDDRGSSSHQTAKPHV